jgi:L-iditol 2-dehydrogenase
MRAAVLHGPLDLRIEDVPEPRPGPGEVRIRVDAALTGGTTAKIVRRGYHARMGAPPLRLGHEGAGTIDAVGPGVHGWEVGDRVVPANSASCGACASCRRGMYAQCLDMTWMTGFFAESLVVPARIVATNLHEVPQGLAPETAALAESLATVLKGYDRTPARAGESAVVIGTGGQGLLWVRVLASEGVDVTAVGRRKDREEIARALGASRVVGVSEFEERVRAGEVAVDLVVEAVGSVESWATAVASARPGGRVHLFGGPPRGTTLPLDTQRLHYDELLLTASFHHTPYHFSEALHRLAHGFLAPALLIQEHLDLADLPHFFRRHFEGEGPLKAAVRVAAGGPERPGAEPRVGP